MTTSPADESDSSILAAEARQLGHKQMVLAILQMIGRLFLGVAVIVAMLTLVPEQPEVSLAAPIVIAVGSTALYIWFFVRQLKGVYRAKYPMLRAMEALILVGAMFLGIFAMIYVMLSATNPAAFTEQLDPFNAYYFALTVLATVGFGDITPSTTAARSVAMVQMAVDIAFIAVLIRIMGGAAKKTIEQREAKQTRATGA
jgi:voltage-gated potassium channel